MRNVFLGVGGFVVLVVVVVITWPRQTEEQLAAVGASDTSATGWDLPVLDGEGRIALADFRGKPTVAAFFANWCTVCEVEIPEFLTLSQNLGDRVNFVGINTQDNARGLGDARKWGIEGIWPIAMDIGNGNNSALSVGTFGARGMPMTVVYTADGEVADVRNGYYPPDQLLALLESLGT